MNETSLEQREELLDRIEEFVVSGYHQPAEIIKILSTQTNPALRVTLDRQTAKRYLSIIRRRIRNKYYTKKRYQNLLYSELASLELMEKRTWTDYYRATKSNERAELMRVLVKIKERRAAMMGIDVIKPMVQWNINTQNNVQIANALDSEQLSSLISSIKRIESETGTIALPGEPDTVSVGVEGADRVRTDLPATPHEGESGTTPQGDSVTPTEPSTGDSGSA